MKVVAIVGGAVVGAAITIATAGTAELTLGGYVILGVETTGAGLELWSQSKIDGIADEFFLEANNCHDQNCAEQVVRGYFEYLSRMTRDLTKDEKTAIDNIMANLIELLPSDSQFLIDTVAGCYEENDDNFDIAKCDDGVWNPEQVIRAVGIGLQFTSVFASVGTWILRKAGMIKTIANQAPNMTKALQKKIPETKEAMVESTNKGKLVKTSNGKEPLWIRAFKNTIPEVEARINRLLDDMFGQKLVELGQINRQQNLEIQRFIERNKGMLFHGSATDYKDGFVQAFSGIHKNELYAASDFDSALSYATTVDRGFVKVKSVNPDIIHIPTRFQPTLIKKYGSAIHDIKISDSQERFFTYVYSVKPEGFKNYDSLHKNYFYINGDVERVDRITIPMDSHVLFFPENSLSGVQTYKISSTAYDIDNAQDMSLLKKLLIYEDYLKELSKIIK